MDEQTQGELFSSAGEATGQGDRRITINERCQLLVSGGDRMVMVHGLAVAHFRKDDRVGEAHAIVSLVDLGYARQNEVARAFGCSTRSVRRYHERFCLGGLSALGRPDGYPLGKPRLKASRIRLIEQLKAEGRSNRAIASRMGVDEKAIRKLLKRRGWEGSAPRGQQTAGPSEQKGWLAQGSLPGLEMEEDAEPYLSDEQDAPVLEGPEKPYPVPLLGKESVDQNADLNLSDSHEDDPEESFSFSSDTDPLNRVNDRMLAYHGLLMDALPIFATGKAVPCAGMLLAVPVILASGVLDSATEVYGNLGPAFHGLRTTILTFLFMSLLRIKQPESLKERSPAALGRILGLDRVMELKTLRKKLSRLAATGRATAFGKAVAKRRIEARGEALGFLYVDGHVRVYSGKLNLPKTHVTRLRIVLPATTDYYVNDERGDPLFVITAPANAGLTKMLAPVMDEAKDLIPGRRLTVVFDRGGYCFDLFKKLIADEVDILTYRKGAHAPVPKDAFQKCSTISNGKTITYLLADEEVTLDEGLTLRQVTCLCEDGHQTTILTSRRDLPASEIAFHMFERWRQENSFKYMREEFAIDALVDYDTEPDDAERDVPNPVWHELDARFRKAKMELERLCARLGMDTLLDKEDMRGLLKSPKTKKRGTPMEEDFLEAARRIVDLQKARDAAPRRVPIGQVSKGEVRKLAVEKKHLTTVLKMAASRAETDLFRMLQPFYARNEDEGRTLIHSAFNSSADLEVTPTELSVTLAPLSSPHRSKAIAKLCQKLNETPMRFPGTKLNIRFSVTGQDPETGQF